MAQDANLLTSGEAAAALRVSARTINDWATKGRLNAITLPSGRRRFRREDVEALLVPTTSGGDR